MRCQVLRGLLADECAGFRVPLGLHGFDAFPVSSKERLHGVWNVFHRAKPPSSFPFRIARRSQLSSFVYSQLAVGEGLSCRDQSESVNEAAGGVSRNVVIAPLDGRGYGIAKGVCCVKAVNVNDGTEIEMVV